MKIEHIEWDDSSISHIARHGVSPDEIEEALFGGSPYITKTKLDRYFALSQTNSGRYLAIIFEYLGQYKAQIITARAMSEAERKFYTRRR